MVAHIHDTTRNSHSFEVLRPASIGFSPGRTVLILLFLLLPLLGVGGQTWRLRTSLVELPGGVLVDPAQPAGIAYRGFTGLTLLTDDLARLSHPRGALSAFYQVQSLDGGAERFSFRLSDGRIVELVRVPATPSGSYHYLYRLDPDFFIPPGEPEGKEPESEPAAEAANPEAAGHAPVRQAKEASAGAGGETSGAEQPPPILYVGTMTPGD